MPTPTEVRAEFVRKYGPLVIEEFWSVASLAEDDEISGRSPTSLDSLDNLINAGIKYFKSVAQNQFGRLPANIVNWNNAQRLWTADFIVDIIAERMQEENEPSIDIGAFGMAIILYTLSGYQILDDPDDIDLINKLIASNDDDI